jgi:hypothetical protein
VVALELKSCLLDAEQAKVVLIAHVDKGCLESLVAVVEGE